MGGGHGFILTALPRHCLTGIAYPCLLQMAFTKQPVEFAMTAHTALHILQHTHASSESRTLSVVVVAAIPKWSAYQVSAIAAALGRARVCVSGKRQAPCSSNAVVKHWLREPSCQVGGKVLVWSFMTALWRSGNRQA